MISGLGWRNQTLRRGVAPYFYLIFTSLEISAAPFTGFELGGELIARSNLIVGRAMLAKTGVKIQIDDVHAQAICAEIGGRLRQILRPEVSSELPPRLQYLIVQLAKVDRETAPSLVPSLEDMIEQAPREPPDESPASGELRGTNGMISSR